jgi:3-oxoacyl-[acyl-carrier-protein] synthase-1
VATYLNALGVVCAPGRGKAAVAAALFGAAAVPLATRPGWLAGGDAVLGGVDDPLPPLPDGLAGFANRNNRLLHAAALEIEPELRAAIARYGAARVGVVLGTSTTGIEEATRGVGVHARDGAWPPDYTYADAELAQPAEYLAAWLALAGPAYTISTACTSSARALLSAHRLLRAGVCDAVVCGGVDTLARLPVNGFHALQALDSAACMPFSANRHGINVGEAAALFLMTREPAAVAFLGGGASSDAHHMSSPDPDGRGAIAAMQAALAASGIDATMVHYVNLHGTATDHNDAMEAKAIAALFPAGVPCSSTKALTGHALGAAGALEAAFCWLALHDDAGRLPPHRWDGAIDPALPALAFTRTGQHMPRAGGRHVLSNSFAFGGNNASIVLGDRP